MRHLDVRAARDERGFTVSELAVVMMILSIVAVVCFGFLGMATRRTQTSNSNAQAESDTQLAVRTITSDLRSVTAIGTTNPPATSACNNPTSFATPYSGYQNCLSLTIARPQSATGIGSTCPRTEVRYGVVGTQLLMDRDEWRVVSATCTKTSSTLRKVVLDQLVPSAMPALFTYRDFKGNDLLSGTPVAPTAASTIRVNIVRTYPGASTPLSFSDVVALRNNR